MQLDAENTDHVIIGEIIFATICIAFLVYDCLVPVSLHLMLCRVLSLGFVLLLLCCHQLLAGGTYAYTHHCAQAYNHMMALRLAEGRQALLQEQKSNPDNLMATYIADYEDCLVLLLNTDKKEYERRKAGMDNRLAVLSRGDASSPWYRFCVAGVYLHKAIVNVKFGEQYKAAYNFRKSFALLKENRRLFPGFEYNNTVAGLQEAVVGSLPGNYKWLAAVFGIKGSVRKGTDMLATFVHTHTNTDPVYAETLLYYVYTRFYLLAETEPVWQMLNKNDWDVQNNLLQAFVKVNIALDHRQADAALATLSAANANEQYAMYPVFDYQQGMAMMGKGDTNATYYFARYLRQNRSEQNIKEVWQKMAFVWYINDNEAKANYCKAQILRTGSTKIDADKQAQRFATSGIWPHKTLLRARMLIDGGYYEQALVLLQHTHAAQLKNAADRAEYYFRLGRVYEEMATNELAGARYYKEALAAYKTAMTEGAGRREQYAARAALHSGKIYELLQMDKEAVAMYTICVNMPEHDFQNSIDQQAKAGMNRIQWKNK